MKFNGWFFLFLGCFLLGIVMLWALATGTVLIPIKDVFAILIGREKQVSETWILIVKYLRFPRVMGACLVGGFLAVGGVACQGLFRNPLSEPYLLGMSSGAALGATISLVFGMAITPFAFLGSLGISAIVFIMAGKNSFKLPSILLLSGIAIAFLCQSVIWLIISLHRDTVEQITFWVLGSFSSMTWMKVVLLAGITLPITIVFIVYGRLMDILSLGYENAHGLGLNPQMATAFVLGLTALGTACAVSVSGSIGFVGLMAPHAMRILGGPSHRELFLRSWIMGALLLVLADTMSRTVNAPGELPVGIITSLLGAPFLLALIHARVREGRIDG